MAIPVVSPNQLGRIVLPIGGILKLTVPDLAEEAVPATVKLISASGQPFRRLQYGRIVDSESLRSGKATIPGIAPGAWTVTITPDDGRSWTRQVNIAMGQTTDVVVE